MTQLGIMAYPDLSPMNEIEDYFKLASQYGFTRVTSSMLSVDGSREEIIAYFDAFDRLAHKYGLQVSLDVNPVLFKKLGQNYDDISLFKEIECDILRLDGSYGPECDYIMTQNPYGIRIEMNATQPKVKEELEYFKEKAVDRNKVLLCHNAYPQRYTGLKWQDFLNINKELRQYGHSIMAVVSSNAENTLTMWGTDDGLPTVERLRYLPIDLQVRILLATGDVDEILIGNAFATEAEMKAIAEILKEPKKIEDSPAYEQFKAWEPMLPQLGTCKRLKVIMEADATQIERENVLDIVPQLDMGDSSEWIWRSRIGRLINQDRPIPPRRYEGEYFPVGSVLVVNDRVRHYSGEVQIALLPIANDGKRNLVARLAPDEEMMLELIHTNDLVEFLEYSKY